MDLRAQLPALLGVVVGAVLSSFAAAVAARSQWQRGLAIRWDESRLVTYVEYMNAAKFLAVTALRIVACRGILLGKAPGSIVPLDREEGFALLAQAEQQRSEKVEAVLLLGDTATIAHLTTLTETLWQLVALARSDTLELSTWQQAYASYHSARLDFYGSARRSMGVPSAEIPPGTYWSASAPTVQAE